MPAFMKRPSFSARLLAPRHWPVWAGLGVLWLLSRLPMPLLWQLARPAAALTRTLSRRSARTVARNLELCFPALTPAARQRRLRAHFHALACAMLCLGIAWWSSPRRLERLTRFRQREHYQRALASGRPVILLAPHFVALDAGGLRLSAERPFVSMYRHPRSAAFDWVMTRARSRFGAIMFERSQELRPLLRALQAGRVFYYLPDQVPKGAAHVLADFFGHPAATLTALSRIARLTGAWVVPCCTRLVPGGRGYEIIFLPPLVDFPSGDEPRDARAMNAAIEQGVGFMPEQYMWTYRRFKARHPGRPSPYDGGG
jgi:KDO2-lipid IV(A) lauroyltransferase